MSDNGTHDLANGRWAPKGLLSRRAFLGSAAFALTSGIALGANGLSEPFRIDKTLIQVEIRDLPAEFIGYRIGQLSDIHYPRNMTPEFVREAVDELDSMKPDVMVITGDLVDRRKDLGPRSLTGMFDHSRARDGILAVMGNHDHWYKGPSVRKDLEQNTPVRLIDHTHVLLERGEARLAMGGAGDLWADGADLRKTFRGLSEDVPRVLLSHNPDVAERNAADGVRVDLQLSGHTHGGEVRIPFWGAVAVPSAYGRKYAEGLVQGPAWPVYINRGICSPRFVRFACRPEVTCIELVAA